MRCAHPSGAAIVSAMALFLTGCATERLPVLDVVERQAGQRAETVRVPITIPEDQPAGDAPSDARPYSLREDEDLPAPSPVRDRSIPPARELPSPGGPLPEAYASDARFVLDRINELRAEAGLAPLRYDPILSLTARIHVRHLARSGEVTSSGADGTGVLDRVSALGAAATSAGSLVAGGYADAGTALDSWIATPSQRERLLVRDANAIGLALYEDRTSRFRYYVEAIIAAQPE